MPELGARDSRSSGQRILTSFPSRNSLGRIFEALKQSFECDSRRFEIALPYGQYAPSAAYKLLLGTPISFHIAEKLLSPKLLSSFGQSSEPAAFMVVPEASMDENTGPETRQNKVRAARKILAMQPKAIPPGMQKFSYDHFGLGIPTSDAGHHSGSRRTVDDVHSYPLSTA